jgi:hypothetical protein
MDELQLLDSINLLISDSGINRPLEQHDVKCEYGVVRLEHLSTGTSRSDAESRIHD